MRDGDERGGASGLNRHGWASKVQFESDASGKIVLVVAQFGLERADLDTGNPVFQKLAVCDEVGNDVGVEVVTGPEADFALVGFGVVAGVFDAFPSEFEEDALLRIHVFGIFRDDAKEGGVEVFDIRHESFDRIVGGVVSDRGINTSRKEVFVGELIKAFFAV